MTTVEVNSDKYILIEMSADGKNIMSSSNGFTKLEIMGVFTLFQQRALINQIIDSVVTSNSDKP